MILYGIFPYCIIREYPLYYGLGGEAMPDYKRMYHLLFNAITDALEAMEQNSPDFARRLLIRAQQDAEELYLAAGEATEE